MDERSLLTFKKHFKEQGKHDVSQPDVVVDLGLDGDSGYPYSGLGDYIDTQVDLSTGTILVRATFKNDDFFIMPGLFAKLRIPIKEEKDALLVPELALSSDQRGRFLLSVKDDGTVEYKAVEIGPLVNGLRVIRKGISEDDRIIVNGLQKARPGAKVTAETAPK